MLTTIGENISDQFIRAGRNHAPSILVDAVLDGRVPEEDLPVLVADAWTMAEYPTQREAPEVWLSLFHRIGYRNAAGERLDRPEQITLYRGAAVQELEEGSFGMSWTTSREQAQWFACRYDRADTAVFRAEVDGAALLADYRDAGRGESEVVVDPQLITDVEEEV